MFCCSVFSPILSPHLLLPRSPLDMELGSRITLCCPPPLLTSAEHFHPQSFCVPQHDGAGAHSVFLHAYTFFSSVVSQSSRITVKWKKCPTRVLDSSSLPPPQSYGTSLGSANCFVSEIAAYFHYISSMPPTAPFFCDAVFLLPINLLFLSPLTPH